MKSKIKTCVDELNDILAGVREAADGPEPSDDVKKKVNLYVELMSDQIGDEVSRPVDWAVAGDKAVFYYKTKGGATGVWEEDLKDVLYQVEIFTGE